MDVEKIILLILNEKLYRAGDITLEMRDQVVKEVEKSIEDKATR